MKKKTYSSFQDLNGNHYGFDSYLAFATWFFSISRRVMKASLSNNVFAALEKEATKSRDARRALIIA